MTAKRILKTRFYPVSIDARTVINDPQPKERMLAWKYRGRQGYIGIRGRHLLEHACYWNFNWIAA